MGVVRSLALVWAALALGVAPDAVLAQPAQKLVRLGYLSAGGRTADGGPPRPFREGISALGYVEGRTIAYETRFADGKFNRLPDLAAELVRNNVDILAVQGGLAVVAAARATTTIPIVMVLSTGDAVATGLITSLARPGGNVTGMTDEVIQLSAKRMEILKEAVPKATRIALVWNRDDAGMTLRYREIERAARAMNVDVQALGVREPEDFQHAFTEMARRRPDAMFVVADALTILNRKQLLEFASTQRTPTMYEAGLIVRDGGLLSYGPNTEDQFRRAAVFVDRIIKGAKPGELPAEQPTRYYLSINRKTAAALGLTISPSLLIRADDVID
jgi:putative ABC transport system substrate-binding protein